ncbi:MAG TPA: wax ester/triacylglycerol synthase family O-acyltransferase [Actinomycetales bacterium]|nr:wax ester/triacylglycerol synthase family O-acyltransferase [Actinomycetales bacterium]
MTQRRPVTPVDSMWLAQDRPNNLMVINAVMFLDGPVDVGRLDDVLRRRLVARFPVFHQRPVRRANRWFWEDDPDFALDRHVHHSGLPRPGTDVALRRYVEQHMTEPLDFSRPLWQLHVVGGYRVGRRLTSALLVRVHHSLADGIALAQVLLTLTDEHPDADTRAAHDIAPRVPREPGVSLVRRLPQRALGTLAGAVRAVPALPVQAIRTIEVADKLVLGTEPRSRLTRRPGVRKRVAWSGPLPLADVRITARQAGVTINDVLMCGVAGVVRRYLDDSGSGVADLTTMVPVNLRPADQPLPAALGNRFTLVLLRLPATISDPAERLAETARRMDRIKDSPEVALTFTLINGIGLLPHQVGRAAVDFFASKAFGVTTNVIGPTNDRYLAGVRVSGVLGWVPGSGQHCLGVCLFTYAGTLRVGFAADAGAVPDPQVLVEAFETELDGLLRAVRSGAGRS